MPPVTLVAMLKSPAAGVRDFQAYEARVLPLLAEHGGTLQRRLRNGDGTLECHLLQFPTRDALEKFRNDPHRTAAAPLLAASGATADVFEMTDVEPT